MILTIKKRYSRWADPVGVVLFCCLAISVTVLIRYRWREENWKQVVQSDGCGYYGYLPAVFIYGDLQYRFYEDLGKQYRWGDLSGNFLFTQNGKFYNRYYCGTAILQAPFFLSACAVSALTGHPVDGHSFPFYCAVNLAAIFYALAGLYFLSRVLRKRFTATLTAFVLAAVYLGSNVFTYTVYMSSYSHAYSFGAICFFIYLADRSFTLKTRRSVLHLAICLALVVLIRPTNGLVILSLPFIAGSGKTFAEWWKKIFTLQTVIPSALIALAIVSVQSVLYYYQCGSFWIYAYKEEGFDFLDPHILDVLFSYRAGVFTWSPAIIPALLALVSFAKNSSFRLWTFSAFMLINLWVISSWWAWHYEGTYGMRPMVDHMGFFAVLLAYASEAFRGRWWKITFVSVTLAGTFIGHVYNFQFIDHIVPYEKMTKEKYWYIFLKTAPKYRYDLDLPYDPGMPEEITDIAFRHVTVMPADPADSDNRTYTGFFSNDTISYPGTGRMDLLTYDLHKLKPSEKYYAELKAKVKYSTLYTSGHFAIIFIKKGEVVFRRDQDVISPHFKTHQWNNWRMVIRADEAVADADEVLVRFENGETRKVELQQLEFCIAGYR